MTSPPPWVASYIGIPWRSGGRTREAVDCYGIVRLVLEEHGGVRLPTYDTVAATDLLRAHEEIEASLRDWRSVARGAERPFDVLQINRTFKHAGRFVSRPVHLGVVLDGGNVLHAEGDGAAGVVLADLEDMRRATHAIWRHKTLCNGAEGQPGSPFDCRQFLVEPGATIADIIVLAGIDDATLDYVEVWVGGTRLDKSLRDHWHQIRPKAGKRVTIATIPQGGGGLRIAAMVGVMALATAATVFIPGIGGALAASMIMGGGMFAVNKFLPEPIAKPPVYNNAKKQAAYSITGGSNERSPGRPVPVLLGRHKFTPPSAAAHTSIRGQKVYYRTILVLSTGPVTDPVIFIGDTPLSEYSGVEVTFDRGWHPKQLRDRGKWNPNIGYPTGRQARPGDKWTADRAAGKFSKNDFVVYNGLYSAIDERAWDHNPGRGHEKFLGDPVEERFDVALEPKVAVIRETAVGTDEITVDFVCPTLGQIRSKGQSDNYTVKLQIYESPVESPENWRLVDGEVSITGGASGPKETFGSRTWRAGGNSASKKYRVRVKRTNPLNDTLDNTVYSDCKWFALKSFGDRPLLQPLGLSTLMLDVKGSGQLSGVLDKVRVICQTLTWDWDGTAWVWRGTSNPASLVRHIWQMPQWPAPLTDAQIDLPRVQQAAEFCTRHKLEFNSYVDFSISNLHEFLGDIGIAGFFAICRRHNKRSMALDPVEGGSPVRLFVDGVNCWDVTTRDVLGEDLHAVRVNIADEAKDWGAAERLICADGYTEATATRIEDATMLGITSTAQATLLGRARIADRTLRREEIQLVTNIQGLSCEIGDVVAFASDDLAVSTARGRISTVLLADDGDTVIGVTLTHPVEMEDLGTYGISYIVGTRLTSIAVITEPGIRDTVLFASPPARAAFPEVGAVFSFAPSSRVTMPMVIRDIHPDDEDNVRITLVGMPATIQELKTKLPPWNSYATLTKSLPTPVVTSVLSTAREMILTAQGDLVTRVVISLAPVSIQGIDVVVMVRPSGVTDDYAIVQATKAEEGRVGVIGLQDGYTYDLRVQYVHADYFPSQATEILSHRVAGKLEPPAAVENLRLVVIGPNLARLHWEQPEELDVRYGGTLLVKHSPEMFSASWLTATSLSSTEVSAAQLSMIVPLMTGTYLVMTRDSSGNLSREFATVNTDGASIDEFDTLTGGTIVEEPLFLGNRFNVGVVDGTLRLLQGSFDDVVDVDQMPNWDAIGLNVVNAGVYYFADTHDMGEVNRVRLRRRISQSPDLVGDLISKRLLPISQWPSISGTVGVTGTDVIIEVRTTTGDPAAEDAIWSPWTRLDIGEWVCRGIQGRAWLITEDASFGVIVSSLQLFVEERVL